ncbi:MAG: TIGR04283 family arsenosugar biosynthesis glycosyltransferase [Janthinobacterium lividum]
MPDAYSPAAPAISLLIPTFNEAASIGPLLAYLRVEIGNTTEILVADGGSTDSTRQLAAQAGVRVLTCPHKGRAAQLNHGAVHASGSILYFLHADSYPPPGFENDIRRAVAAGAGSGCYRLAFDHRHWFLRVSAWMTRWPLTWLRFGDQSLFVQRELFVQLGGYREDLLVMEDQELVERLQRAALFRLLPRAVVTSARKYLINGVFRLQGIFALIVLLYRLGVPQARLLRVYRALVRQGNL